MTWATLTAYVGVCIMVALTPGPDTFLVLRYSLLRQRYGITAALGMVTSIFGWAMLAGAGAAALMQRFPVIEKVIAIAGGLYLLYLGISGLLRSRRVAAADSAVARTEERRAREAGPDRDPGYTLRQTYAAGLLSSALNPKLGLLFLAMMPAFIPGEGNTLLWGIVLGGIFALIGFLYLVILSVAAARAVNWFKRPEISQRLEWVACGALSVMGLGVLFSALF